MNYQIGVCILDGVENLKKQLEPLLQDDKEPVRLRAAAGYLRLSAIEAGRVK